MNALLFLFDKTIIVIGNLTAFIVILCKNQFICTRIHSYKSYNMKEKNVLQMEYLSPATDMNRSLSLILPCCCSE